eukprot:Awhi_evm2s12947
MNKGKLWMLILEEDMDEDRKKMIDDYSLIHTYLTLESFDERTYSKRAKDKTPVHYENLPDGKQIEDISDSLEC